MTRAARWRLVSQCNPVYRGVRALWQHGSLLSRLSSGVEGQLLSKELCSLALLDRVIYGASGRTKMGMNMRGPAGLPDDQAEGEELGLEFCGKEGTCLQLPLST